MPLYAAGQKIRGSEINALPQLYRVQTEQSNNTTSFINCAGLAFQAEVNAVYLVELFLFFNVKKAADMLMGWTVPGGAVGLWTPAGVDAGSPSGALGNYNSFVVAIQGGGLHAASGDDSSDVYCAPHATITNGGTAGTVQFRFSQFALDAANPCKIRAGSCMRVSRMA